MAGCIPRPAPSALFACSSSQPHKAYTPLLHSPLIAFEQKKWSCGGGASQKSSCTSTPLLVANIARSSSSSGLETHTNSVTTAAAAAADESNQDNRPTISNVVKVRHADLLEQNHRTEAQDPDNDDVLVRFLTDSTLAPHPTMLDLVHDHTNESKNNLMVFEACHPAAKNSKSSQDEEGKLTNCRLEDDLLWKFLNSRNGIVDPYQGHVCNGKTQHLILDEDSTLSKNSSQNNLMQKWPKGKSISDEDPSERSQTHIEKVQRNLSENFLERGYSNNGVQFIHGHENLLRKIEKCLADHQSLENHLDSFSGEINTDNGNLMMQILGEKQLALQALSLFHWMQSHDPCLLNTRSYSIIFKYLGQEGLSEQALMLFEHMPQEESYHCVNVYNSLIGALLTCGRLDFILNSSYGKYCRRNVAFLTVMSKLGFTHEALILKRLSVINQALEGGGCSLSLKTETDTCGIRDGDHGFQINNNQEDQQNDFAKDYALTIWLAEFLEDTLSNALVKAMRSFKKWHYKIHRFDLSILDCTSEIWAMDKKLPLILWS